MVCNDWWSFHLIDLRGEGCFIPMPVLGTGGSLKTIEGHNRYSYIPENARARLGTGLK